MGFIYTRQFSGGRYRNVLCCDVCSEAPARKIQCPYGWCQATAACAKCRPRVKALDHADCKLHHDNLEGSKSELRSGRAEIVLYECESGFTTGQKFYRLRDDRQGLAACCIFNKTWVDAAEIRQLRAWGNHVHFETAPQDPECARMEFERMVREAMIDSRVTLGNVEFWIDAEGPWAGQLSSSLPTSQWDTAAITADLTRGILA